MKNEKIYIYCEDWMHRLIFEEILNKYCVQKGDWSVRKKFEFYNAKNNGEVIKQMIKVDSACIGIIDNDKKYQRRISEFESCIDIKERRNFGVRLVEKSSNYKYLFILDPAPERWILRCSEISNISISNFELPENFQDFKDICKESFNKTKVQKFVKQVIKSDSSPVNQLLGSLLNLYNYHN